MGLLQKALAVATLVAALQVTAAILTITTTLKGSKE